MRVPEIRIPEIRVPEVLVPAAALGLARPAAIACSVHGPAGPRQ